MKKFTLVALAILLALSSSIGAQASGRGLSRDLEFNLDSLGKAGYLSSEKVAAIKESYRNGSYRPDVVLSEDWIGDNYWVDTSGRVHRRVNGPNGKYFANRDPVPLVVDVVSTEFGPFMFRDSCRNLMVGEVPKHPIIPTLKPAPNPIIVAPPPPVNLTQRQEQSNEANAKAKANAKASASASVDFRPTIIINLPGTPATAFSGYGYSQLRPGESGAYGGGANLIPFGSSSSSSSFYQRNGGTPPPSSGPVIPPEGVVPRTKPPFRPIRPGTGRLPGGY